jgi:Protein of unknown function (DUF3631)
MSAPTAPAAEVIDGAQLLNELHSLLTDYVVFPAPKAADAVTLWIAATHAQPAWQHATRLRIGSPMKRCGKSRLLDVIEHTSHKPVSTVDATIAALFRSIDHDDPPTLIVDEADAIWAKKAAEGTEDLRKLLNAGFGRGRYALRCVGPNQKVEQFATFAMVAIAGIGDMPDTITDRAVNVILRRRAASEKVKPFKLRRDVPPLHDIRGRLADWVASRLDDLTDAEPDAPVEDRAADVWEPLIAVADAAGGTWPERARAACLALSGEAEEDDTERSVSLQLLADLRSIFGEEQRMHGVTILEHLHRVEGAPWGNWYGRLLNANDLASLLRPYGVHSVDVKVDGQVRKGYRRDPLYDAWTRYLPLEESKTDETSGTGATPATPATPLVTETEEVAGSGSEALPATSVNALTREVAQVAGVARIPDALAQAGNGQGVAYSRCIRCDASLSNPAQRQRGTCGPCFVKVATP